MLSWNGFSQTVTEVKDTTHIVLSTEVARRVAVDLLAGDLARAENSILSEEITSLTGQVYLQQQQLLVRDQEIETLQKLRTTESVVLQQQYRDIEELNKTLKHQMNLKTTFQVSTGVAVIALIVSLLAN